MKIDPKMLVARIQAGDHEAESLLVDTYYKGLLFLSKRITRQPWLAEETAQQTMQLVLEKIRAGEPQDPERLNAFIQGVARNLATGHYRKENRRGTHVSMESAPQEPADDREPDQTLLHREQARIVSETLAHMKDGREKEMLTRFYIQEEDKEPICKHFGISSQHFNRVLYQARQTFKALWVKRYGKTES